MLLSFVGLFVYLWFGVWLSWMFLYGSQPSLKHFEFCSKLRRLITQENLMMFSCHQNFKSYLNSRFVTLSHCLYEMDVNCIQSLANAGWDPLASSLEDIMGSFPAGKVAWCYCLEKPLSYWYNVCVVLFVCHNLSNFQDLKILWNGIMEMKWYELFVWMSVS